MRFVFIILMLEMHKKLESKKGIEIIIFFYKLNGLHYLNITSIVVFIFYRFTVPILLLAQIRLS